MSINEEEKYFTVDHSSLSSRCKSGHTYSKRVIWGFELQSLKPRAENCFILSVPSRKRNLCILLFKNSQQCPAGRIRRCFYGFRFYHFYNVPIEWTFSACQMKTEAWQDAEVLSQQRPHQAAQSPSSQIRAGHVSATPSPDPCSLRIQKKADLSKPHRKQSVGHENLCVLQRPARSENYI